MRTLYNIVFDNIVNELHKSKKTQKDLMDFLNISKNVFTDWKSGKNKSYMKHLPKIAEFFGISVDKLTQTTEQKNKADPKGPLLTENQQKLYDAASDLPDEVIKDALDYIDYLKSKRNQKPD